MGFNDYPKWYTFLTAMFLWSEFGADRIQLFKDLNDLEKNKIFKKKRIKKIADHKI